MNRFTEIRKEVEAQCELKEFLENMEQGIADAYAPTPTTINQLIARWTKAQQEACMSFKVFEATNPNPKTRL